MQLDYDPGYGPLVDSRVRIATWNIWARYGPWEARAPVIAAALQQTGADIVGLQEVWDDGTRNQARELADALGFDTSVWAPNLTFAYGVQAGNAIISRWPVVRQEVRALPAKAPARATTKGRNASSCSRRSTGRAARSRSSART